MACAVPLAAAHSGALRHSSQRIREHHSATLRKRGGLTALMMMMNEAKMTQTV